MVPALILTLGLGFFFFVLPVMVDKNTNGLFAPSMDLPPSDLHQQLFVSDLHADTLLWNRPLGQESQHGHVDFPRLKKGRVALQAFSVVTKTPLRPNVVQNSEHAVDGVLMLGVAQRWPLRTWGRLSQRALYQAERLKLAIAESQGQVRLIQNHEELIQFRRDRERNPELMAAWLTIEGGHALDGDLALLDELYNAGFRMVGPAHLTDNELAGSQSGEKRGGLTALGRQWLKKMEEKRMIVDLAHLSPTAIDQVLAEGKRPPVVSHTGIRAICDIPRNLSDEQLKKIADKGGLIGIGLWEEVLCQRDIKAVVKSMRHVCDMIGCEHVALGSDWDGFVNTAVDAAHIGNLTVELQKAGFSENDIRLIMGENIFRFLLENLP